MLENTINMASVARVPTLPGGDARSCTGIYISTVWGYLPRNRLLLCSFRSSPTLTLSFSDPRSGLSTHNALLRGRLC